MKYAHIAILALLFFTACSDPLPEHYGVFALDGGKLTQLGDNTPEELRRNFSKNISIIVFDKRLGAAADLNELLIFTGRAYVRNQIEHVLARVDGPEKTVNTTSISNSIPRDTINVNYKPVEGKPEMVQAVPVERLEPGLYAMIFPPDEGYFFSVGIGNIAEAESPHNDCLDLHVTTVDKDAPFSWKMWNQLTIGRAGQRRMIEGNPIMEEKLEPCAAWDGLELGLRLVRVASGYWDVNLVRELLEEGAYIDAEDEVGTTALAGALILNSKDVAKLLVEAGADVNKGREPALVAAANNYNSKSDEDVTEMVKILLEAGADVNARDYFGTTALQSAKAKKNAAMVELLKAAGATE